ncbi:hypothetical protein CKO23_11205 [Thiocystis violacea]|nr:hypothetical protein [Thiocystis violacea]
MAAHSAGRLKYSRIEPAGVCIFTGTATPLIWGAAVGALAQGDAAGVAVVGACCKAAICCCKAASCAVSWAVRSGLD